MRLRFLGKRKWCHLLVLTIVILLQGCGGGTELYSHLSEREANEVVATLARHGITADRTPEEGDLMTVTVDQGRFARAVDILTRAGLPERKFANMGEVFKSSGLVSSPGQERAQMVYALSQELSNTLSQIDGVVTARVQVVLPNNDFNQRNATPSSASVFIRYLPTVDIKALLPQIKTLVANGISGLSYDNVSVVPVAADIPDDSEEQAEPMGSFLGMEMPVSSLGKAHWIFGTLILLVVLSAGCVIWLLLRSRRTQQYVIEGPH